MHDSKEFATIAAKIRGGVKPNHAKNTAECETVFMPAPEKVIIPMQQHIGAPCEPCVAKGDTVYVGTKIGDSDRFVSAPIHSSVSGTVSAVKEARLANGALVPAVEIENDGKDTPDPTLTPPVIDEPKQLIDAVRNMGLVGLGGAGFPAHVKLTVSPDKPIDTLIINGAECEPYITADYRECLEEADDVLHGIYLVKDILKIKQVIIAIEDNKPKAIDVLYKIASDKRDADNSVRILKLKSLYPQGAEKVLIYTATGRKMKQGSLPADVGCIVMNITSIASIGKYHKTGMPLVRKRLTVDGNAISESKNLSVAVGTPVKDVIEFCGGFKEGVNVGKIISGGPMMGAALDNTDTPVVKQNNAILVFDRKWAELPKSLNCIRCGRCVAACPMQLTPPDISKALSLGDVDALKEYGVMTCIECGSCAFSCPSKRPLVQMMRTAKTKLRNLK